MPFELRTSSYFLFYSLEIQAEMAEWKQNDLSLFQYFKMTDSNIHFVKLFFECKKPV